MAYAAVISLKQTIDRLVNPSHTSMVQYSSPEIMKILYEEVRSLQEVLEGLDKSIGSICMERMNTLDGQIRETIWKLEDVIETQVSNQFLSQNEERSSHDAADPFLISIDLEELKQDFDSLIETVKKMKEDYIQELRNPLPQQVKDAQSRHDNYLGCNKSKMVGVSRLFSEIQAQLIEGTPSKKTTLAKALFEDSTIVDHFECRVWVTVGPTYRDKEILRSILDQGNPGTDTMPDDELADYLSKRLKNRIWLVVLDDVWNSQVLSDLLRLLPDKRNGNRVLVTSRIHEEASWEVFCHKVFDKMPCPVELKEAGKKIAENCEGLPLTIVKVANLLFKADKTTEYWNEVAAKKQHSVFLNAYAEMLEVLLPSYYYLPQHLKAFFLYMGILPQNYGIPLSKLINLWKAEGFLEPNPLTDFEQFVKKCLDELISRNVVIFRRKMYFFGSYSTSAKIEKYYLNSAFLYMCVKEAGRSKFYQVLNSYTEDAEEGMKSQRRLCIHNNVLFAIEDAYNSIASVSTVRSLLCTGPYHQYAVPICLEYLRLLRVLDALTIRFYKFPIEVLIKLIQLRYLALTYDENLPASISKLWNLQFFIIRQHLSIVKSPENSSYLPMEIWDMKQLEHLEIMGNDLPNPNCEEESLLPNLLTLLDVSPKSCTKSVFKRLPNLKKLGIRIESESNADELLSCFDYISHLNGLETLKCTIENPVFTSGVVVGARLPIFFPKCLKKLCLSGLGYPWEEMTKIGSLPNLRVLKLHCNAFRGPKWETRGGEFPSLEYLLIEDSDLAVWTIGDNSFNLLGHLNIRHCYKLKEIQGNYLNCIRKIEVVDCNPLAAYYARQILFVGIDVRSSWEEDDKINA
ncbi:hypothetical protein MIMGU_mgv1a018663mg [Erythranthe guttata]|uniref:NB-ARC domain-containing protein n=2 Tax=Erythranthe guttata TaxID=4155 RepID=A0A022PU11_ERYGU|nr:hypothetical protein MIMGU_mgv1a018663mg [Erythranthe guttata]